MVWADALAVLVEDGQVDAPGVLLGRLVDRLTVQRVRAALLGQIRAGERRFAEEVEEVFGAAVEVPAPDLPAWAEAGIRLPDGREAFSGHTLDLDAAEAADGIPWPPVTVMVYEVSGTLAGVLLEVGPGGMPHRILSRQARRLSVALVQAADLADRANQARR